MDERIENELRSKVYERTKKQPTDDGFGLLIGPIKEEFLDKSRNSMKEALDKLVFNDEMYRIDCGDVYFYGFK